MTSKMTISANAAVLERYSEKLTIQPVEVDQPRDDEVLVKISACGICHTDIVVRGGALPIPLPVVLGHEGAGHVVSVGSTVSHVKPGDAVLLSFSSCGSCRCCMHQEPAYCHEFMSRNFGATRPDGSVAFAADGQQIHSHFFGQSAFATHAVVPERNVVKAPDDLPLEQLAPLGCGIQTGAGSIFNELEVRAGSSVLIMGAGAVGMSAIMAAKIADASMVIALDRSESRLRLAQELGASHSVLADGQTVSELLATIGISGVDYILDTTGAPALVNQAVACLNIRGTMGLVAAYPHQQMLEAELSATMIGGRRILGIVEGNSIPATFIPRLIEYHREGLFPYERLIEYFPFAKINEAIAACESGDVIKPVLRMY